MSKIAGVLGLLVLMGSASRASAAPTELKIRLTAYIPVPTVWAPLFFERTPTAPLGATLRVWSDYIKGDNRAFDYDSPSYRARIDVPVRMQAGNEKAGVPVRKFGVSELYKRNQVNCLGWIGECTIKPGAVPYAKMTAQVTNTSLVATTTSRREGDTTVVEIRLGISGSDPLVIGAPTLDADFKITLREKDCKGCSSPIQYTVTGAHDGFPSFELYMGKTRIYGHEAVGGDRAYHPSVDQSPFSLMAPMEFTVNKSGSY